MRYIFTLFLIGVVFFGFGQAPMLVNYQGVARDASLTPIPNQTISLKFEVLQGSASGAVIYTDTQPAGAVTNAMGLFSTQIGKNGTLGLVNWQGGPYYLQVSMDQAGGGSYVPVGIQQIVSVPFAMHAASVPSTYTNNILTVGSKTHAINSGTSVTLSHATGTNVIISGGPDYTVSFVPPALALNGNNLSLSGGNTVVLPVALTPTLVPSGIVTVTNGASSYTVGVAPPIYNPNSGVMSFSGNNTVVTPTLGLSGGILYSGPFTNSVALPAAVTVAGTGLANVTGGPNYVVNVAPPTLALSSNNLSISIVGSNSVALPAAVTVAQAANNIINVSGGPANYVVGMPVPIWTGTALTLGAVTTTIAPTLNFNAGTLTVGAASNTVDLSGIGPFKQAGTSVTLTTASNSVAIGSNAASAKLDVFSNTGGTVFKVNDVAASNASPAAAISSGGVTSIGVTNTSASGVAGDFTSTGGYALFAQNNSALNPAMYVNNSHSAGLGGYFKGGIVVEGKVGGNAFNAKNASSADIFTVREDGTVGIGTNVPVAKLDVNGNLRLNGGNLYLGGVGGVNSGYTGLYSNGFGDLTFAVFKSAGLATPFGATGSMDAVTIEHGTGNVGIGIAAPAAKLDVVGNVKIADGTQANGKVMMSDATGVASWKSSPPAISFGGLNNASANISNTPTNLGTSPMVFTKQYASTEVEVMLYANAYTGSFASGASTVYFEIYIDGNPGTAATRHHFFTGNTFGYISIKSYFSGLSAGSHTINIIAVTDAGVSNGALLDSGGYGGKVLVKETF